ncbi:hypothetical protein ACIA5C_09730 [Actinoplanes sp. NPDC051343]|uniref:hypothetical protein n=1 Tax=Actinoplanes sp. NPDC051343 TaxID=3363906 RepID=UPI003794948E
MSPFVRRDLRIQQNVFALAGDPDLLVLDEPTTGMDVAARQRFWTAIRAYAADGQTVFFSTHQLHEADDVADRVVVLAAGRIVADGPPAEIRALAGVDMSASLGCGVPRPDHQDAGRRGTGDQARRDGALLRAYLRFELRRLVRDRLPGQGRPGRGIGRRHPPGPGRPTSHRPGAGGSGLVRRAQPAQRPRARRSARRCGRRATVADIAGHLHLSESTVRNHLSAAIGKTSTRNCVEAAHRARSNGWIWVDRATRDQCHVVVDPALERGSGADLGLDLHGGQPQPPR